MRIIKTSTIGHLNNRRKTVFRPSPDVLDAFRRIISILQPYEPYMQAVANTSDHYELWTRDGFRTSSFNPKRKRGLQFAAAILYERHVGLYFLPLYISHDLHEVLSDELQHKLKGQSCFHFSSLTDNLENEVRDLISAGWEFYRKQELVTGLLRRP